MSQEQWDGVTERRGEGRGISLLEVVSDIRALTLEVRHLAQVLQKSQEAADQQRVEDRKANRDEHEALQAEVRKLKEAVYNPKEGLFADNSRQQAEILSLSARMDRVEKAKEKDSDSRTRVILGILGTLVTALLLGGAGYAIKGIIAGG